MHRYLALCLAAALLAPLSPPEAFAQEAAPTLSTAAPQPSTHHRMSGAGVLYEQYGPTAMCTTSQEFEEENAIYDNQAADDFVVPAGGWTIEAVGVLGVTSPNRNPIVTEVDVVLYEDDGGRPGSVVYEARGLEPLPPVGEFVVNLPTPATLGEGTYWLSVVADMDFGSYGQFYWCAQEGDFANPIGNPYHWQNPGGGFVVGDVDESCTTWQPGVEVCSVSSVEDGGPDLTFRLFSEQQSTEVPRPPHDDFADAMPITTLPYLEEEASNVIATFEPDEPMATCGGGLDSASVWYAFTPSESGYYRASTETWEDTEDAYHLLDDTILSVYTGTNLSNLTQVACNDDLILGEVTMAALGFEAVAGETYYLRVAAFDVGYGTFRMALSQSSPAPSLTCNVIAEQIDDEFGGAGMEHPSEAFVSSPALLIPDGDPAGVQDTLHMTVGEGDDAFAWEGTIERGIPIHLDIDHEYIGDLVATLTFVNAEGEETAVTLFDTIGENLDPEFGCDGRDVDVRLYDEAQSSIVEACNTAAEAEAAAFGFFQPQEALDAFVGQELGGGSWILSVADPTIPEPGTLVRWCLDPLGQDGGAGGMGGGMGASPVTNLSVSTSVASETAPATSGLMLAAPRPNPFSSQSTLVLALDASAEVTVVVFDALGRRVATLHEGRLSEGEHHLAFEGAMLPSGLYLVRAAADGHVATKTVTLVR